MKNLIKLSVVFLLSGCAFGPMEVWLKRYEGEAKYAEAESSRKIQILEAEGKLQAAKNLAQAEVERAKGVAEANKIIGNSLKDNENYLKYLWIHNLSEGKNETIYIPTEAGLPILESNRRNKK